MNYYELSCEKCNEVQAFSQSGGGIGCSKRRKERLIEALSQDTRDELSKIENEFSVETENVFVFSGILKCSDCKKLSLNDSFEINLSANFKLVGPVPCCDDCGSELRDIVTCQESQCDYLSVLKTVIEPLEFSWQISEAIFQESLRDSLCPACGHVGLKIERYVRS